ncbi:hypothetical protein GJ688_00470 [Heliobacillus mobilis]|uniref:Polymer-forming cytoskeletal protein n=1 Tax=Heliobacterium mobile TaxID=28064 RepID=A0A6I3SF07_HELMO|nr:polymer-forming cytoskeletal protein [Heliobacterium mobile]MTV47450.1 hypothetical protein [Heliobacterium mobile]
MKRVGIILKWFLLSVLLIGVGAAGTGLFFMHSKSQINSPPFYDEHSMGVEPRTAERDPRGIDTVYVRSGEQRASIQEAGSRVIVQGGQVLGDVTAKEIRVEERGIVAGNVNADYNVIITGGHVRSNVTAREVRLYQENDQERNSGNYRDFSTKDPAAIGGAVKAFNITVAEGTQIAGTVVADGKADLAGTVGDVTAKNIVLRSTAVVKGNIQSSSDHIVMEPGAQVSGTISGTDGRGIRIITDQSQKKDKFEPEHNSAPIPPVRNNNPSSSVVVQERGGLAYGILFWIPVLIGLLALSFISYSFLFRDTEQAADSILMQPLRNLWIGFLTVIALGPLVFLTGITILGIPIAIGFTLSAVAAAIAGWTAASLVIGRKVSQHLGPWQGLGVLGEVLIGAFLLAHLGWVPLIGWFILFLSGLMGFGAVTRLWYPRFRDQWREWRQKRRDRKSTNEEVTPSSTTTDSPQNHPIDSSSDGSP